MKSPGGFVYTVAGTKFESCVWHAKNKIKNYSTLLVMIGLHFQTINAGDGGFILFMLVIDLNIYIVYINTTLYPLVNAFYIICHSDRRERCVVSFTQILNTDRYFPEITQRPTLSDVHFLRVTFLFYYSTLAHSFTRLHLLFP